MLFFNTKESPMVISVGGSLIVPDKGIDYKFLSNLNFFIRQQVKKGHRFFLVSGGGNVSRQYRDAGRAVIGNMTNEDLDWLGIHATRLNAHLLRTIFQDIAHPRIIENYDKKLKHWKEPVVIGAGWKPGWSTDYDAVLLARDYHSNAIINLSDVDWLYDKDPNKYKDAKPIKKLAWEDMEEFVGSKWTPGKHIPFDPIAAKLARQQELTVIITNGHDFNNLEKIIEGDVFKGTVITPYKIDTGFYDREYYTGKKGGYRFGHSESLLGKLFHCFGNLYRALVIKIFLKPKSCLDVGCGTGSLVKFMRRLGIEAYGLEISDFALEFAHQEIKPYLKKGDIVNIPYPDNSFDLVLTFDVLEHLERSKIKKAIRETVRVSKKYILHKIYTKENCWINFFHRKDFSHLSVFSKRLWQKIFSSLEGASILRGSFFRLPSFFETIFLLRKNSKNV